MFWYTIKNYFKLRKFMKIRINILNMSWFVYYKKSYNDLNEKEKALSDEHTRRLRIACMNENY